MARFLRGKVPQHHTDHMTLSKAFAAAVVIATATISASRPAYAQYYSGTQTAIGGAVFQNGYGPRGTYSGASLRMGGSGFYNYSTPSNLQWHLIRIGGTTSYNFQGY